MVRYLNVEPTQSSFTCEGKCPYLAVVISERTVSESQRWEIARGLCETGCRYMMAWGPDCSLWDDAVDHANLAQFGFGPVPTRSSVVTTWHEDESLDEVFCFAKHHAMHPDLQLGDTLLLHFGDKCAGPELLRRFEAA